MFAAVRPTPSCRPFGPRSRSGAGLAHAGRAVGAAMPWDGLQGDLHASACLSMPSAAGFGGRTAAAPLDGNGLDKTLGSVLV